MTAHVKPMTYWIIFAALVLLTGLTVWASGLAIAEPWHSLIALTIALVKASLVVLFFMHVLYSSRLIWVVALGGLVWLAIMIAYTLNDYMFRA